MCVTQRQSRSEAPCFHLAATWFLKPFAWLGKAYVWKNEINLTEICDRLKRQCAISKPTRASALRKCFFLTQTIDLSSFPSFHILQQLWALTGRLAFPRKKKIVSEEFLHVTGAFGDRESTVVRASLIWPLVLHKPIFSGGRGLPAEKVYRKGGLPMVNGKRLPFTIYRSLPEFTGGVYHLPEFTISG